VSSKPSRCRPPHLCSQEVTGRVKIGKVLDACIGTAGHTYVSHPLGVHHTPTVHLCRTLNNRPSTSHTPIVRLRPTHTHHSSISHTPIVHLRRTHTNRPSLSHTPIVHLRLTINFFLNGREQVGKALDACIGTADDLKTRTPSIYVSRTDRPSTSSTH